MMYCRLPSMVFKKARGQGIVWRCLKRMYRPLLKENISVAYDNVLIDILCDIFSEKEAGREIFVPFIVTEGIGFLCWRPRMYDIGRL
jgi:hypothetical protein